MATALSLDGLTSLRRLDPDAAALGGTLCALIGDAGFDVAIVRETPVAASWFACPDGIRFRILRCGGQAVPLDEGRIGDAVALLDRIDPVLARIEQVLDLVLEPDALGADLPQGVILSFEDEGTAGLIAVPPHHAGRDGWEARARTLAPPASALPVIVRVLVDGPRLGIAEAGELAAGDLVLVGAAPSAILSAADDIRLAGAITLSTGYFTLDPQGGPMATETPLAGAPRDFAVPLTLRLPDRLTSAASLAALRPGMALPLGPLTEGMPIDLLVAGRMLARGELVQLGDRFAVLIEERASIADVSDAPPLDIEGDGDSAEADA